VKKLTLPVATGPSRSAFGWFGGAELPNRIQLASPYDTRRLLVDNGQVYYEKMDRLPGEFLVLDGHVPWRPSSSSHTKEVKNILISLAASTPQIRLLSTLDT